MHSGQADRRGDQTEAAGYLSDSKGSPGSNGWDSHTGRACDEQARPSHECLTGAALLAKVLSLQEQTAHYPCIVSFYSTICV